MSVRVVIFDEQEGKLVKDFRLDPGQEHVIRGEGETKTALADAKDRLKVALAELEETQEHVRQLRQELRYHRSPTAQWPKEYERERLHLRAALDELRANEHVADDHIQQALEATEPEKEEGE
jgi:hypothetical protein